MNCINCGAIVDSKYCQECGQSQPPKKIRFLNLYHDLQSRIYGFDGMFPRTLRDLTIQPGVVARAYINGNRVKYNGPVGYFFLMITVFVLLLSLLEVPFYDLVVKASQITPIKENSGMERFIKMYSGWITDNMKIFSFLVIPFIVLASRITFRKSGLNMLEHSVMVFYIQGHIYWLTILSLFIFKIIDHNPLRPIQPFISLTLYGLGCSQLFNYQGKTKAFFKGIGVYLIGMLLFVIFFTIAGFFYVYSHPEYYDMIRPKNN
ncbi:MAG: DUF3667 domain-containing protein [Bacteroidia bacterium]|nr:DUF3667 domain-containing protein [Bacteroidia bacterium]